MNLIALMGESGSGKDTAGQILIEGRPGMTMAFAAKLKEICSEMYGVPLRDFYDPVAKERPLPQFPKASFRAAADGAAPDNAFWTPREIAQWIGTEGFRSVAPAVWPNYLIRRARAWLRDAGSTRRGGPLEWLRDAGRGRGGSLLFAPFVVVTDGRFKSEMLAVRDAGGEVWRIRRPRLGATAPGIAGHVSETEMADIPDDAFDAVIDNSGSLEHLREQLVAQLQKFFALDEEG